MATQLQMEIFRREIAWPTASCEAETIQDSLRQNGKRKLFLYPCCLKYKA